jgi:hypothetical protein
MAAKGGVRLFIYLLTRVGRYYILQKISQDFFKIRRTEGALKNYQLRLLSLNKQLH